MADDTTRTLDDEAAEMERVFADAIALARMLHAQGVEPREQGVQMGRMMRAAGFELEEAKHFIPRIVMAVMQERRH